MLLLQHDNPRLLPLEQCNSAQAGSQRPQYAHWGQPLLLLVLHQCSLLLPKVCCPPGRLAATTTVCCSHMASQDILAALGLLWHLRMVQ